MFIYKNQGRILDEASLLIQQAYKEKNPLYRYEALRSCQFQFEKQEGLKWYTDQLKDDIALLEKEVQVEQFDANTAAKGEPVFQQFPRFPIVNVPLSTFLYYCTCYHKNSPEKYAGNPQSLIKTFKVHDRRILWTSLRAKAKMKEWEDLKNLVVSKGFFSGGIKSAIGFEPFVEVVYSQKGPYELLAFFINQIDPYSRRAAVASKYGLYDIAVDAVLNQKDKNEAINFQASLLKNLGPDVSLPYRLRIEEALSNPKIKWNKS